ncbi:hypothetical protein FRB94_005687 [Tulasnella sp. JGI-2019a]|nr:hypothetical protein FRB94_005687 [Tulasnella sp. JGI-2019a]KAG9037970.1 hypothetical protein FRB95_003363 [Tulasnella sp. JGI-2019a]
MCSETMIGPLMEQVVVSHHRESCATRTLPNELLDLVLQRCHRATLVASCLVNTNVRSIAIAYLYEAPFDRNAIDFNGKGIVAKNARVSMLCRAIANNPHLALLVRELSCWAWGSSLDEPDMKLVLPHLHNLTIVTGLDSTTRVDLFITLCPSLRLRTVRIRTNDYFMGEGFIKWLASQKDIRDLTIWRPRGGVGDLRSRTFENLERFEAGIDIARAILPTTTSIRHFVSMSRPGDVAEVGELLCRHCPNIHELELRVANTESVYVEVCRPAQFNITLTD